VRGLVAAGAAAGVRLLVLALDVETVVIGGGLSRLGERLLGPVRTELGRQAADSPFLASLELAERVRLAPTETPVPAIGAALIGGGAGGDLGGGLAGAAGSDDGREDARWRS
jgi:predicted NBD/HSP70 family sugar kinase